MTLSFDGTMNGGRRMVEGIFRVNLPDGSVRLAAGDPSTGPRRLLASEATVGKALGAGARDLNQLLEEAESDQPITGEVRILAPVDTQEIWAAGVTYRRSRDERKAESTTADVYDRVYVADRPELFFKSAAWRVRGPGEPIGVRADSAWNVPEPELGVVVASDGSIAGFVIGNDVSSRTIEGENPLYLPQAKVYDGSCALGPCLVPADQLTLPLGIHLTIERDGAEAFTGTTSSAEIKRTLEDLIEHLMRALALPDGAILLTGTGIVPAAPFTLLPGDVVRIEIDGLGVLENPVVSVGGPEPKSGG
jgi:2-dehydro-3-deoxy-D-arabinonate dehydratase